MLAAAPPPPPLVVTAPAEREVSFGHVAGRVQPGDRAIVVRADEKLLAVKRVEGGSFDLVVALPRRDTTVRVSLYGPYGSTLKLAIAVEALRAFAGKPAPGSYLDSLLRRMLIESDNDAAKKNCCG